MPVFTIEVESLTGHFRVVETHANGFHVLGVYDDRGVAERMMSRWRAEAEGR